MSPQKDDRLERLSTSSHDELHNLRLNSSEKLSLDALSYGPPLSSPLIRDNLEARSKTYSPTKDKSDVPVYEHFQTVINSMKGKGPYPIFYYSGDESESEDKSNKNSISSDAIGFEDLKDVISFLQDEDGGDNIGNTKIGVLFRPYSHTTPLCIEKRDGKVFVYNTDSVLFHNLADEVQLRDALKEISEVAPVYSLGYNSNYTDIGFKRQHSSSACATFSMHDIQLMLQEDFHDFFMKNSVKEDDSNIYTVTKLSSPQKMIQV